MPLLCSAAFFTQQVNEPELAASLFAFFTNVLELYGSVQLADPCLMLCCHRILDGFWSGRHVRSLAGCAARAETLHISC